MKILVINCGSSSLKYQVIDSESEQVLCKGLCERIGIDGVLTYEKTGSEKVYESKEKSWPVCMFVLHFYFSRNERILF